MAKVTNGGRSRARQGTNGLVTRRELAEARNVHMMTVTKWERAGLPVAERGRKGKPSLYDPAAVAVWLDARETHEKSGFGDLPFERARLARVQADKTELDVRRMRGELVEAREVEDRWASRVLAARERLLALPGTALQQGIITTVEQEDGLIRLVSEAWSELIERVKAEVA